MDSGDKHTGLAHQESELAKWRQKHWPTSPQGVGALRDRQIGLKTIVKLQSSLAFSLKADLQG